MSAMTVRLRPLKEADAYVSVHWRNISGIWRFTASAPDRIIAIDDELAWIRKAIADPTSRRFAIEADGVYIGNIYLTDIRNGIGEYHIFIGNRDYWGRGIAREASLQIIAYGRDQLGLSVIRLGVHKDNKAALALYELLDFTFIEQDGEFIRMELDLNA